MIIYSINNHQAIEFIENGQSFIACDSSLQRDATKIKFHIQPNRLNHGVSISESTIPFSETVKGVNYYRWNNKTIAWVYSKNHDLPPFASFDFLVVSSNSLRKKDIINSQPRFIIFDGSNSNKFVPYLAKEIESRKIATHFVAKDGAFIF